MSERTMDRPEEQDEWDLEHAEKRVPSRRARAIVSVAFPREDFEAVEIAAERLGKKLSEFIREAAVARALPQETPRAVISFAGMSSGTFFSSDVTLLAVTGKAPANVNMGEPEYVVG